MRTNEEWSGQLHDATLVGLEFNWSEAEARLLLRVAQLPHTIVTGDHVRLLEVPHEEPWGPSVSVNAVRGPAVQEDGWHRLEIEMQTGDVIAIEARAFRMERQDS